jgi:hypothetical protein
MVIISAAALTTLEQLVRLGKASDTKLDQQDRVRNAVNGIVKELRDVAAAPDRPQAIERVDDNDIIFKTVSDGGSTGANTMHLERVRYCLDLSDRNSATLRQQTQSWDTSAIPEVPSTASCPAPGWSSSKVVAEDVTNMAGSQNRPVFKYRYSASGEVQSVVVGLFLDVDPQHDPHESRLESAVFLRNQNRLPVARFTATPTGVGHIFLNASDSVDPEDQPLEIRWYDGDRLIGRGQVFEYNARTRGTHMITLEVQDVGELVSRMGPVPVEVQ